MVELHGGAWVRGNRHNGDDANEALKAGAPVEVVYPDQDDLGTLVMPTSVVLIRGGPNPDEGRGLIDYLLSDAASWVTGAIWEGLACDQPDRRESQEMQIRVEVNTLLEPRPADRVGESSGTIDRRKRLGGLLNFYYRKAA